MYRCIDVCIYTNAREACPAADVHVFAPGLADGGGGAEEGEEVAAAAASAAGGEWKTFRDEWQVYSKVCRSSASL
jgi:hypothetical protein